VSVLPRYTKQNIRCRETSSFPTQTTGFIDSGAFTLNPYVGGALGCAHGYAAFLPRNRPADTTH